MMMGNGMMYGGIWWMLCAVFGIILLTGIVLFILWVVKAAGGNGRGKTEETPLDILKKRYAGGEITREEFEKMKRDIS